MKKEYVSPEIEFERITFVSTILATSTMNENDVPDASNNGEDADLL